MGDFLAEMAAESIRRARIARGDLAAIESRVPVARPPIPLTLSPSGFDLVAEAKLASPSEGILTDGGEDMAVTLSSAYVKGGAAALSVLTEETRFNGSLGHLERIAATVDAPVMRKDFLVEPVQREPGRARGHPTAEHTHHTIRHPLGQAPEAGQLGACDGEEAAFRSLDHDLVVA